MGAIRSIRPTVTHHRVDHPYWAELNGYRLRMIGPGGLGIARSVLSLRSD